MFWRKKRLYDVASGVVNARHVTYSFTHPVSEDRAKREFRSAIAHGLPSGSVIIIP